MSEDSQNPHDLLKLAKSDPRKAVRICRDALKTIDLTYYQQLYQFLAVAYGIASQFSTDYSAWFAFTREDYWKDRRKKPNIELDREKALPLVMMFVLEANDKRTYDRSNYYARSLKRYFDANLLPEEVADRIERDGGIDKLYQDEVSRSKAAKKRIPSATYIERELSTLGDRNGKGRTGSQYQAEESGSAQTSTNIDEKFSSPPIARREYELIGIINSFRSNFIDLVRKGKI